MSGIKLPRWLLNTTTMQFNSIDVILLMALSLKAHGTADQVRQLARNIRDKVCMEHRPKMRALARLADDALVMRAALNIVQRGTDALGSCLVRFSRLASSPLSCHHRSAT